MLATCYYRAGKHVAAYSLLSTNNGVSSRCRLLLARCCVDLKKFSEAEEALLCSFMQYESKVSKCVVSHEDLVTEFGESASFAAQLLAHICAKTERLNKAVEYYKKSLKLNPFLWSSFENLVQLGVKVDPSKIFDVTGVNFNLCHGFNPLINLWNSSSKPNSETTSAQPHDTLVKEYNKANPSKFEINSPFAVIKSAPEVGAIDVLTPENNAWTSFSLAPHKLLHGKIRKNYLSTVTENTPALPARSETPTGMRLSFGVFPLGEARQSMSTPIISSTPIENPDFKVQPIEGTAKITRAPVKRHQPARRSQLMGPGLVATRSNAPKTQIFSQSGNINSDSNPIQSTVPLSSQPTSQTGLNLRRSSRLFNSSSSVKENSKTSSRNQENNKTATSSSKTPTKKTKKQGVVGSTAGNLSSTAAMLQKESELNEINKSEAGWPGNGGSEDELLQAGLNLQKASAEGLMNLLIELGKALVYMGQFHSQKAIDILEELPLKHYNSGWVLSSLGRACFELAKYEESCKYYDAAHVCEPYRLQGMEYYSTALWHLQREVKLSNLAQELIEFDKNSPQTWCVAGNCFSLQKEHETAIKFLQRAIQVDSDFAYAYTLLGHELVLTEEMDHAMACFRNAIRIDPRHYNAWYGIGMICFKQEKYQLAEIHYRKALEISPFSPVLMCHLGVVQNSLKKTELALQTLNKAIEKDPKNALCKFQRASVYCSMERHNEALSELEQLKQIVPKESLVYFMIGKVRNHERILKI